MNPVLKWFLFGIAALAAGITSLEAADWTGSLGSPDYFSDPANWDTSAIPQPGETVNINVNDASDPAVVTTGDFVNTLSGINVGGAVLQDGGTLDFTDVLLIGSTTSNGTDTGVYTMTGGTLHYVGFASYYWYQLGLYGAPTSVATMEMSGTGANAAKVIIDNGALAIGSNSIGNLVMHGDSSIVSTTGFAAGVNTGEAHITMDGNASFDVLANNGTMSLLGQQPGTTSTLTLTGNASFRLHTGVLSVGNQGGAASITLGTYGGADNPSLTLSDGWITLGGRGYDVENPPGSGTWEHHSDATQTVVDVTMNTGTFTIRGNDIYGTGLDMASWNAKTTWTQNGGTFVTNKPVYMAVHQDAYDAPHTNEATLNLNGGTFQAAWFNTAQADQGANTNVATINFNGGRLQSIGGIYGQGPVDTQSFIVSNGGTLNLNVQEGGAVIDSKCFNISLDSSPLEHDTGTPDGGLHKWGRKGTLRLANGVNTYTGETVVHEGRLSVISGTTLVSPSITVESRGILGGNAANLPPTTVEAAGTISPGDPKNFDVSAIDVVNSLSISELTLDNNARLYIESDGSVNDLLTLGTAPIQPGGGPAIVDVWFQYQFAYSFFSSTIMQWSWHSGETAPTLLPAVDGVSTSELGLVYTAGDDYTLSRVDMTLNDLSSTQHWVGPTSAWSAAANWVETTPPNGDTDRAFFIGGTFGSTDPHTVNLDAGLGAGVDVTLSSLVFDDYSFGYTLSTDAGKKLFMKSSLAENARISVQAGSHTLAAPLDVVLMNPTRLDVFDPSGFNNSELDILGAISDTSGSSGPSCGLTVQGGGVVKLLNPANTYAGPTVMKEASTLEVAWISAADQASSLGQPGNTSADYLVIDGTFRYTGATTTTNRGFTFAGIGGDVFDVTDSDANLTFTGPIQNESVTMFKKTGPGTLTLACSGEVNLPPCDLLVSAGTLVLANGVYQKDNMQSLLPPSEASTHANYGWTVVGFDDDLDATMQLDNASLTVNLDTMIGLNYTAEANLILNHSTFKMAGSIYAGWDVANYGNNSGKTFQNTTNITLNNSTIETNGFVWLAESAGVDNAGNPTAATMTLNGASTLDVGDTSGQGLSVGDIGLGILRVNDTSRVIANQSLTVGWSGHGYMTLSNSSNVVQAYEANTNPDGYASSMVRLGRGAGSVGMLTVEDNASILMGDLYIGQSGAGALYIKDNASVTVQEAIQDPLYIARNAGSIGLLDVSGGTLATGDSAWAISIIAGWWDGSTPAYVNVRGNGLINCGDAYGSLIVNGGGVLNIGAAGDGTPGGTLQTAVINNNGGAVNFHGGTLKATPGTASATDFIITGNVNIYSDYGSAEQSNAKIDTNGQDITINQMLLDPNDAGGQGISAIALTTSGSGYIQPPIVQISGGGTGATAVAVMNSTYPDQIDHIQITNPGTGYGAGGETVTLIGDVTGSGASAATTGTISYAANVSGGLTKLGTGKLTLTAANTYTGPTIVSEGTLSVASILSGGTASPLGASGSASANLVLDGGTLQYTGASATTDRGFTLGPDDGAVEINNGSANLAFSGNVVGDGLIKTGPGTLTLTGGLTYTGTTDVQAGLLQINSTAAPVVLSEIISSTNNGDLSVGAGVSLTTTSIQVNTLSIGAGSSAASAAPVPEPNSFLLLALAGAGILLAARKRIT
ncbi:MAG: autotransporter-associated beta strand repeat-containing protein [Pirellulales bacterium]|nr:autotransporter-associated beta strand repeat-containing protein [Pirellulales bacterium]